jgi:putative ABC transport system permease protein
MVFTEIPGDQAAAFDAEVAKASWSPDEDTYLRLPFATGRISGLKGQPVDKEDDQARPALGLRQRHRHDPVAKQPKNAGVVAGRWWTPTTPARLCWSQ